MIILYNPRSSAGRKPILPMSLLAIAALLEGKHRYRIIDGNIVDDGLVSLRNAIRESSADILGITVMPGPQLVEAVPVSKALKAEFPDLTIVWGGYFPTLHPDTCLESQFVDYLIRGHNEESFVSLIDSLRESSEPGGPSGLAWRDSVSGELRKMPLGYPPDLNSLPDFPYHTVDMERYMRPTFMGDRTISHHSSYGCPFMCNFCAVVNMVSGRYAAQDAEHTSAVVHRLVHDHGANAIEFYDNNFFVQESRIAEISERITPLDISWWGYGRVDTMLKFSDRTWKRMKASGLKMVFMGAETGSDETLKRMNKGGRQTTNQALEIAARMRHYGIVPEMSFVFGNPPDPASDIEQTIAFIKRLKNVNPATEIIFYLYSPVPLAGDLYSEAQAIGFQFPKTLDEWVSARWQEFAQHRSADLPWLDVALKKRLKNFQQVLHAAYPTITDASLSGARRQVLRLAGQWRYRLGFYHAPLELKALDRLFPYKRPETSGF